MFCEDKYEIINRYWQSESFYTKMEYKFTPVQSYSDFEGKYKLNDSSNVMEFMSIERSTILKCMR